MLVRVEKHKFCCVPWVNTGVSPKSGKPCISKQDMQIRNRILAGLERVVSNTVKIKRQGVKQARKSGSESHCRAYKEKDGSSGTGLNPQIGLNEKIEEAFLVALQAVICSAGFAAVLLFL